MRRFAKTVVKVLLSYVEIVKADFPEQMKTERIVSSLSGLTKCDKSFDNVSISILGVCTYE